MSGYTKFEGYNQFSACGRGFLQGDTRIMNPLMSGNVIKNPFRLKYNDMRVPPLVPFQELNYNRMKTAYPQAKLDQ